MRGPKWENPRAKFYFPKELNERKRRAHYGHDRFTYNFTSLLEVARFMRAYLLWDNARPKTPFTKLYLQMAGSLLGKVLVFDQKSHKPAWQLNRADLTRLANRLTSAGINPQTFQIQDQIRARWAWHQLSDYPYFYSEYRQAILLSSDFSPPPLDHEWFFTPQYPSPPTPNSPHLYPKPKRSDSIERYSPDIFDRLFSPHPS